MVEELNCQKLKNGIYYCKGGKKPGTRADVLTGEEDLRLEPIFAAASPLVMANGLNCGQGPDVAEEAYKFVA